MLFCSTVQVELQKKTFFRKPKQFKNISNDSMLASALTSILASGEFLLTAARCMGATFGDSRHRSQADCSSSRLGTWAVSVMRLQYFGIVSEDDTDSASIAASFHSSLGTVEWRTHCVHAHVVEHFASLPSFQPFFGASLQFQGSLLHYNAAATFRARLGDIAIF